MTTTTQTYQHSGLTTDSLWRAAIKAYEDVYEALGVTKTAATGQVDTATITTATTTAYSQRAWVHGSRTLYIRTTYTLSSNSMGVAVQCGETAPAAASSNITNTITGFQANVPVGNTITGNVTVYGTVSDTHLALYSKSVSAETTAAGAGWIITHLGGTRYVVVSSNAGSSTVSTWPAVVNVFSAPAATAGGTSGFVPHAGYPGSVPPDVEFFPLVARPEAGAAIVDVPTFLFLSAGEVAAWATVDVTVGGTSRTYLVMPGTHPNYTSLRPAVIYQ